MFWDGIRRQNWHENLKQMIFKKLKPAANLINSKWAGSFLWHIRRQNSQQVKFVLLEWKWIAVATAQNGRGYLKLEIHSVFMKEKKI